MATKPSGRPLLTHRLEPDAGAARGAVSVLGILLTMAVGPCLPIAAAAALATGRVAVGSILAAVTISSLLTGGHSPKLCAAYLKAAGWFKEGVFLHFDPPALDQMREAPTIWRGAPRPRRAPRRTAPLDARL